MADLRFACRQLLRNPGYTFVAVVTLALGIGANTAIFSLVDAVLLKSLPVPDPQRLFFVNSGNNSALSYPVIRRFQNAAAEIGETFAYRTTQLRLGVGGRNEVALGQLVSGNYFSGLGFSMLLGRGIGPSDDQVQAPPVVVLSAGCWERRFGGDPAVVGRTVSLNGVVFTVIGVAPREFFGLDAETAPELFAPVRVHALLNPGEARLLEEYGSWVFPAVIRLQPGVSREAAQARLSDVFRQLASESAAEWIREKDLPEILNRGVRLDSAARGVERLRQKYSRPLWVLTGASALVFLIACANVAHLLLVRGAVRRREIALRLAVGSSRSRVAGLLLAESLLLSGLGSALGLMFAVWSRDGLGMLLPEEAAWILQDASLDGRLLAFLVLTSIGAAALVGLAPALRGSNPGLSASLHGGTAILSRPGRISRLGGFLAMSQVALSLVLLIGATLLIRTMHELRTVDPGFRRENVVLLTVQPELAGYGDAGSENLMNRLSSPELLDRLDGLPGVHSASLSSFRPFGDRPWWRMPIQVIGTPDHVDDRAGAAMHWVTPRYFETLGIPLLKGRAPSGADGFKAPKVAVINETMSRQYFGDPAAVGRRFKLTSGLESLGEIAVIGVVRDTRTATLRDRASAMFYLPFAQFPNGENLVFALRHSGDWRRVAQAARREIEALDANLVVTKVGTLSQEVGASMIQERAIAGLSGIFGGLALVLAAVGLYGVLAHATAQRVREIGLRMALGAQTRDVAGLILGQGLRITGIGLVIGMLASLSLTRILRSQLFGVSPTDPLTFSLVPVLLGMVALLACWLPARRAARIDPILALRE